MANARALLKLAILAPIAALIILFSIANRTAVVVSFDPFNREAPALSVASPLYLVVLGAIAVGVIAGGIGAWLAQGRHRRAERSWRREAQSARSDADRLRASLASHASPPQ